jgi:hypothetical protein
MLFSSALSTDFADIGLSFMGTEASYASTYSLVVMAAPEQFLTVPPHCAGACNVPQGLMLTPWVPLKVN